VGSVPSDFGDLTDQAYFVPSNFCNQLSFYWALWELFGHPQTSHLDLIGVKKGSSYSITERRVPELIPVLGSQPAGDTNHKPDGRLPLLSARPAVTPATLERAALN